MINYIITNTYFYSDFIIKKQNHISWPCTEGTPNYGVTAKSCIVSAKFSYQLTYLQISNGHRRVPVY